MAVRRRGSRLFDKITRLEEYYPTETERTILRLHAEDLVAASDATTLVELGSGEEIRVEISTRFRPETLRSELGAAGFTVTEIFTDRAGDFALTLARLG